MLPGTPISTPPAPPATPAIVSQPTTETSPNMPNPAPPESEPQEAVPQPQSEVQISPQSELTVRAPVAASPIRPPSQGQQPPAVGMNLPVITNNWHIPVAGFPTAVLNDGIRRTSALNPSAPAHDRKHPSRVPTQSISHFNGVSYDHLRVRQLQWAQWDNRVAAGWPHRCIPAKCGRWDPNK